MLACQLGSKVLGAQTAIGRQRYDLHPTKDSQAGQAVDAAFMPTILIYTPYFYMICLEVGKFMR